MINDSGCDGQKGSEVYLLTNIISRVKKWEGIYVGNGILKDWGELFLHTSDQGIGNLEPNWK